MNKFQKLILFSVVVLLAFDLPAISQVVVEKSKDKVIISGKPYYIHIVKKGETVYSISKAYQITPSVLTKENPGAERGVKTDQSLRIPVVDNDQKTGTPVKATGISKDDTKFIYHKLDPGETVFALSKKYGVSEEEIVQSNQGIEINKMPVGFEIAIPKRQFISNDQKLQVPEKNILRHKVVKGENLYSIAEKYGITVKELRKENKGLLFPKVDDFVRIPGQIIPVQVASVNSTLDSVRIVVEEPVIKAEITNLITPVHDLNGTLNVAILLPIYLGENAIRTEIDSSRISKGKPIYRVINRQEEWILQESIGFLELYEGILIAADTLRSQGLNVNLYVHDIKSDTIALTRLIESGELRNMDLIIGPVYSRNLSIISAYANNFEIPVVSPVQLISNNPLNNNPFLFMANPSLDVAQNAIAGRLTDFYDNNFIFIHSDTSHVDPDVSAFKNKIFSELVKKIPYEDIKFKEFTFYSRSTFDEDSINRLEHSLSDKTRNFVIIGSDDIPLISESISDLYTLSKKFDIRLMGYPIVRGLDNIDPIYFFELGIELFSPYWIDTKKEDVKKFNYSFRQKFLTQPSESSYAWVGYDIAYYFLSGLAIHGKKFISNPDIHNPDLLQTSFQFRRKGEGGGFENHKLFLIKFTNDMDIILLDDKAVNASGSIK